MPRARGAVVVLVLLCALVCAQSASFICSEHSHGNSSEHCCWLCHIGPLPLLGGTAAALSAPVLSIAWVEPCAGFDDPCEVPLPAHYSRGPPAQVPA